MNAAFSIRPAAIEDLPAITAIYNHAVLTTVATFDTTPKTVEDQTPWFNAHGTDRHPIIVAERDGEIAGWGALSAWSDRCAYNDSAEISVYVAERFQGQGLGRALVEEVIRLGRKGGLHVLVSRIAEDNDVSVKLTESLGFTHVGLLKEVGNKFGRRIGVIFMQYIYE